MYREKRRLMLGWLRSLRATRKWNEGCGYAKLVYEDTEEIKKLQRRLVELRRRHYEV